MRATISVLTNCMASDFNYLSLALSLADELEAESLIGPVYFKILLEKGELWDKLALSDAQKLRLFNGYYELTVFWGTFQSAPLQIAHSHRCTSRPELDQQICSKGWTIFWRALLLSEVVTGRSLADVSGRLKAIETMIGNSNNRVPFDSPVSSHCLRMCEHFIDSFSAVEHVA